MNSLPNSSTPLCNSIYLNNESLASAIMSKAEEVPTKEEKRNTSPPFENHSIKKIVARGQPLQKSYNPTFDLSSSILKHIQGIESRDNTILECKETANEGASTTARFNRKPIFQLQKQKLNRWAQENQKHEISIDDEWRKKRDLLAEKARKRRAEKAELERKRQEERLAFEKQEEAQSDIEQENQYENNMKKQQKIQQFFDRQQFALQERQVFRQMRQFCTYGSIKLNGRQKIYG